MNRRKTSFDQALIEGRKQLPSLGDSAEMFAKAMELSEYLMYYAKLLSNEKTTALEFSSDTRQTLIEIVMDIDELLSHLVPDQPEQIAILQKLGFYDSQ